MPNKVKRLIIVFAGAALATVSAYNLGKAKR